MTKIAQTTTTSFILPLAQLRALRAAAESQGIPQSVIVRRALARELGVPDTVRMGNPLHREAQRDS